MVRAAAAGTLYDIRSWPPFAQALAAADAGDPGPMLDYAGSASPVGNDAQIAVLSVDQQFDRRVETHLANGENNAGLFDHFWWDGGYGDLIAGLWPVEDRGVFRGEVENPATAATILVIGITYDPATPYIWSERLTADLGNARLLTYQSDGHGALPSFDPCVLGPFVAYLYDGVLPPAGARCVDQRPRFPTSGARSAGADADAWVVASPRL
jgi:hypothetical protein